MSLPFHKVVKLGPLRLTFGRRRLSSWNFKLGKWSWGNGNRMMSRLSS